jgi:cobalt-zinc-cadmium efflux system outer membrane protein
MLTCISKNKEQKNNSQSSLFTRNSIKQMIKKFLPLYLLCCLLNAPVSAQSTVMDTLKLSMHDAEKMFLDSNLLLLAQKYNIAAQQALVIQARLYPNPNLAFSRGPLIPIHTPATADMGTNFDNSASLSQLILLAGKRNKQIKIAQANATLAEYQFFDLLRTLKYTLRTDFYTIYYLQRSAKVYQQEIDALKQVADAFIAQQGKGYVSDKEVIRIRAQLYSFQSEYNDLQNQINSTQSELRVLLKAKPSKYLVPQADTASISKLDPMRYPLKTLLDSAFKNRTDLLMAHENTEINRLTYKYQKALACPDMTLSISWDHQGSYVTDYNSAGIAIDLPVWNRNQGNIKMARIMIDNTVALEQNTQDQVEDNISTALQKTFAESKLSKNIDSKFTGDFDRLMREVMKSYMERQISILEFLDFYDSYKQNTLQSNNILNGRVQAFEDLNFYTATTFFN